MPATRVLAAALLSFLAAVGVRGLFGFGHEDARAVPVTLAAWRDGSLQRTAERRVGVLVAGRAPFARAYTQLLWSVFRTMPAKRRLVVGHGAELYDARSVREYCNAWQSLEAPDSEIREFAARVATLGRALKALGRAFVAVATPSKAAALPEHIPRFLCAEGQVKSRVAPRLAVALRDAGVPLVDGVVLASEARDRSSLRVFAHYGVHWNHWGAYPATAALLRSGAEQLGDPAPALEVSSVGIVDESAAQSAERAELMGLFWGPHETGIPAVRFSLRTTETRSRRATLVGGSFLRSIIDILSEVGAYAAMEEFNYLTLFHVSYPTGVRRDHLKVDDIDWNHDVFASDVIVLEMNEENGLPDHARLFVEEALRRLDGGARSNAPPARSLDFTGHFFDP